MVENFDLEPELENGPKRNRSITDCVFCIIMLVFWGGTFALMIYAFTNGNPSQLIQTYDFKGTPCGQKSAGTSNHTLIYFFQPFMNFSSVTCVSRCPTWNKNASALNSVSCYSPNSTYNQLINSCQSNSVIDFSAILFNQTIYNTNDFLIYNTTAIFNRFCLPDFASYSSSVSMSFQNMTLITQTQYYFQQYLSDLMNSWKYLLAVAAISVGLSLFTLVFVRCCAGVLVWIILLLYLVAVFLSAAFCGYQSNVLMSQIPSTLQNSNNSDYNYAKNLYILQIVFYVIGGLSFIIILACVQTIAVTIAVIKTSALFVFSNFFIIFVPILSAILISAYIILWIYIFLYLWSVGTAIPGSNSPFATIVWNKSTQYWVIFHAFSLLWNVAFLNYYGTFIISSTCAIWYFNGGKTSESFFSFPILTSCYWGIRYHLGSLALGSLILAVCWLVQLILIYIQNYLNNMKKGGIESTLLNLFMRCLSCYVACFTRFIQFVSELGFSYMAITSKNFCSSCSEAFKLLLSNPLQFGMVNWVGSTFVFIGEIFVASLCGVCGYLMINSDSELKALLYEQIVPITFFVLIGFAVGAMFFTVFGSSSNTVLLCFFVDKELSGKSGRPPCAPEPMKEFYEKYKKKEEISEQK